MDSKRDLGEEIKKLILISEIDQEIYDIRSLQETFPERIKGMEESLGAHKKGLEEADEALQQSKLKKNDKENDLREKEEKIEKHRGDLNLIKNNKEYSALQQEIDSLKADASVLEEEIIFLLDEIEELKRNKEKEKAILDDKVAETEKEKNEIKREEADIIKRTEILGSERKEKILSVDKELLDAYERILANRGRTALALISGESCGACKMSLRPQVINDVKLVKKIVFCESCGRILCAKD
ncbi:MAG: C4-type zinc ribbon domain-containing protein [Candidatus Omnitrophota bacterium]